MLTRFQKFTRTCTRSLNTFGEWLPELVVILIKLALLTLFFSYLVAFAYELWDEGGIWAVVVMALVILVGLSCLVLAIWAVVSVAKNDLGNPVPPAPVPGSLWPFGALVFLPIITIVVAHWAFGYCFHSPLAKLTQDHIYTLFHWLGL